MINFIDYTGNNCYHNVVYSIINPIKKHLKPEEYMISQTSKDNCVNVIFFNEWFYTNKVGKCGTSVFIAHGIADKRYSNINRLNFFDIICVPGEAWREKLIKQGVEPNRIKIIGWSKLDNTFSQNKINHTDNKIHILYAPTHNNPKTLSSYPKFCNDIKYLNDDLFEIKTSYHPFNNNSNITFDLLLWADVIISDCSSLVYEAWSMDIPVIFPDWIVRKNILKFLPESFEFEIYSNNIGYHANNIKELKSMIHKAYKNGLDSKTINFIEGIFPKYLRGNSGKKCAEELLKLCKE